MSRARGMACSALISCSVLACGGSSPTPPLDLAPAAQPDAGWDVSIGGGFDGASSDPTACVKKTCADYGANCGPVADGCGGLTQNCGSCPAGQVCGGGGTASVCGTNFDCVPTTCEKAGANCGPIGDGCGGSLDCGTCSGGLTCGGGGTASVCGVTYVAPDGGVLGDGGTCIKKTCADYGANCGPVADGCGGVVDCGTCSKAGEICGASQPNVCGSPFGDGGGCTPKTCADYGANCGPVGDGCGGVVECGTCTAPNICGGGGKASVCGNSYSACTKKTCADYGANCGQVADGCGGLTASCGSCSSPYICGGGGTANVCGNPYADDAGVVCKPKTCADYGATCGWIGDGCGGTAYCGSCTFPDICGGGGVPSKCGGSAGVTSCSDPLCAKIPICMPGNETSITGTVYAPNGVEPLYNAAVYVPMGAVAPFGDTVTCDRCDTPKSAIATAVTGPDGKFTLKGAIPAGTNIPLVIELGKWRRVVTIPNVSACAANPQPATLTRLPKKQAEGNPLDNIPRMAMATGNVDAMECVLRKMGLDDSVFADPTFTDSTKRIHFYVDNGAKYSATTPAWNTLADNIDTMRKYDAIIYACRGSEGTARTTAEKDALRTYANEGGRVFATHYSYMWLFDNDVWAGSANWVRDGGPAMSTDTTPLVSDVNTGFAKGLAFSQWLGLVGALSSITPPRVDIYASRKDVTSVNAPTTAWITSATPQTTQHMTFNTPYNGTASSLCGRVLFSDFHVTNANTTGKTFPTECTTTPLTAQEKILEFMLFDLASCVSGDVAPPPLPTCTPKTCADAGAKCGQVADGCGGLTASCGTCPTGTTCGGGGTPGVCGGPTCTPKTCTDLGFTCGLAGDGCGGTLDCGICTLAGETCGGGGVAGKCGGPKCTAQTCAAVGASCGWIGDGCGGKTYCGDCMLPDICGGGGVAGKCGHPTCPAKTCASIGASCGWAGDGCGGKIYCGDCTVTGETCGGGGVPGVCGKPTNGPCTPLTCTQVGASCGPAGDGCGNIIDCGTCVAPETCGGGGVAGKCGKPSCTPTTCSALGYNCGLAADGCGGTLDCGTCTAPSICGGDGVANHCSGAVR